MTTLEQDLLRWAAGMNAHPPMEPAGEDEVYALMKRFRLLFRFLRRAEEERPSWCTDALLTRIRRDQERARQKMASNLEAVREIAAVASPAERPPIVIKGHTIYALTGDESHLSMGADMDVFCSDEEQLWEVLTAAGFEGDKSQWRAVWRCPRPEDRGYTGAATAKPHEFASLSRDSTQIDIHSYYPVLSYPAGVAAADLVPSRNPGRWEQRFPALDAREILYDDLLENSTRGVAPGTLDLVIPDPNMAVVILCAHEFRTSIHPPAHFDTVIRPVTLANILDLTRHPLFDPARFQGLVERFAAHDSVRLAASLLRHFLGVNPFPVEAGLDPAVGVPRLITWYGGWAASGPVEELLVRASQSTAIRRLQPAPVVASADGRPAVYAVDAAPSPSRGVSRVVAQSIEGKALPFEFSVARHDGALRVDVAFLEPLDGTEEAYHVYLYGEPADDASLSATVLVPGNRLRKFGAGRARIAAGRTYAVELSIPREAFAAQGSADPIPLMLAVMKWCVRYPAPFVDTDTIVMVPLEVKFE
ncbi:MAG TPA: nucleotidyltransferase family protein [Longimicrobium sp.]|jgi:hypothetical protein